jgi:hypothetical protein
LTIITRQRSDNFAIIPNAVAEDNRLSFTARGLLVYLLAKPNNWRVLIEDIRNSGGIGRDQAYKLLAELKAAGYIEVEKKRTAPGTYASHNYIVYDNAVPGNLPLPENTELDAPLTENTEVAEPLPENPYPGNTDAIVRTNNKTNTQPSPLPPERTADTPRFLDLWEAWPHRERPDNRQVAEALFDKLQQKDQRLAIKYAEAYRTMQVLRSEPYRMIPYLKQKCFREMDGAPATNKDGAYVITPDRPEWEPWMKDIRDRSGPAVETIARSNNCLNAKTRWPLGYQPIGDLLDMTG